MFDEIDVERMHRPTLFNLETGTATCPLMHMPMSMAHEHHFKTLVNSQSRFSVRHKTVSDTAHGDRNVLSEGYRARKATLVWQSVEDPAPISGHYDTRHCDAAGRFPAAVYLRHATVPRRLIVKVMASLSASGFHSSTVADRVIPVMCRAWSGS